MPNTKKYYKNQNKLKKRHTFLTGSISSLVNGTKVTETSLIKSLFISTVSKLEFADEFFEPSAFLFFATATVCLTFKVATLTTSPPPNTESELTTIDSVKFDVVNFCGTPELSLTVISLTLAIVTLEFVRDDEDDEPPIDEFFVSGARLLELFVESSLLLRFDDFSRVDEISLSCPLLEPLILLLTLLLCLSLSLALLLPLLVVELFLILFVTELFDKLTVGCIADDVEFVEIDNVLIVVVKLFDVLLDFLCFDEPPLPDEIIVTGCTVFVELFEMAKVDVIVVVDDNVGVAKIVDDDEDEAIVVGSTVLPDEKLSFSGDDGGSLEPVSCVIGLYGGIVLTFPPFF